MGGVAIGLTSLRARVSGPQRDCPSQAGPGGGVGDGTRSVPNRGYVLGHLHQPGPRRFEFRVYGADLGGEPLAAVLFRG